MEGADLPVALSLLETLPDQRNQSMCQRSVARMPTAAIKCSMICNVLAGTPSVAFRLQCPLLVYLPSDFIVRHGELGRELYFCRRGEACLCMALHQQLLRPAGLCITAWSGLPAKQYMFWCNLQTICMMATNR